MRLIDILAAGVTDDDGEVLDQGTVTAYEAGSTTLHTIYEDYQLEDPYANPATLDDAGRLIAFSDVRLKLIFHDSAGTLIRTVDNVGTSAADINAAVEDAVATPSGVIAQFGGNSAPTGWLICDGAAVNRTTYAALFAAIGTTWGAGDSVTTFNLPDGRGRSFIGAGLGSGLTTRTLGASLGAEEITLTGPESGIAAHSVTITDPGHPHKLLVNAAANQNPVSDNAGSGISINQAGLSAGQLAGSNQAAGYANSSSVTTGISGAVSAAAAAEAHDNMQPSLVGNWIVKT